MSTELIADIKAARQILRQEQERTHDAAVELQSCRKREKTALAELEALLDALESGVDPRYPLFPEQPAENGNGNGQAAGNGHVLTLEAFHAVEPPPEPTAADETPIRVEPPLRGRRKKGAVL